jgi:VWFA-related protein
MPRRLTPLLSAALLFAPAAFTQQPPAIRARTELVLMPVEVTRHGEHVANLGHEQFTILQDGQPQPVKVFEEVRTTSERLAEVTLRPGEFTNELQGNPRTARYTIIAIDCINTTARDMNRLHDGLSKFFEKALTNEEPIRLIAVLPHSIRMLQDFTSDARKLTAAVGKAQLGSGQVKQDFTSLNDTLKELWAAGKDLGSRGDGIKHMEQSGIQFQERSRRITSLEALQTVALSLAGLPGRKSLVWASSGYSFNSLMEEPVPSGIDRTIPNFKGVIEASALDEYTTHLLNAGNIAVYPVDLRGTINTAYEAISPDRKRYPEPSEKMILRDKDLEIVTTFVRLATSTGGKPCYAREDVSGCFLDALQDSRDYYMLGFYVSRDNTKAGWHKLAVKVAERGVETRSRGGFLYSELSPEQLKNADLTLEIGSRFVNPGLPFRGRWASVTRDGDARSVRVELSIPVTAQMFGDGKRLSLEVAALARREDGSLAAQFGQHIERDLVPDALSGIQHDGLTYKNDLHLAPGKYAVRIVVRDNNTGRMGSLTTMLTVD